MGAEMYEKITDLLPLLPILIGVLLMWIWRIRTKSKEKLRPTHKMKEIKGHDIFLSYARPDRSSAEAISDALGSIGWKVWWDRSIPPGKSFDQILRRS